MFEEPQAQYNYTPKNVSLDDYLEMISDDKKRYEYHDGKIMDIKSATVAHGRICTNLVAQIDNCVREKDCDVFAGDRELWIADCNKMFFPDVMVVCNNHELKQMSKNVQATINPSVVIEVLSESTADYDKTDKRRCYKKLKSLKQIIFISQTEKYIHTVVRTENDRIWNEIDYFEDEELVPIGDCLIPLNEIYRRVSFDVQSENATD